MDVVTRNRLADGSASTVTCVVIEAERPSSRGRSAGAGQPSRHAVPNMTTTIGAMVTADTAIGAIR
jgi:hypothetical protein